jgi:integrase
VRGNVTRRGKSSWRLKFDVGIDAKGKRSTRFVTVRGRRQDAERELTKLLAAADAGTLPAPSKVTVVDYIEEWLSGDTSLGGKTVERYRELLNAYIAPHLGSVALQKLRPAQVAQWQDTLLKSGGQGGRPLSARSVGHARRVLHKALERAVERETLSRNVVAAVKPPRIEEKEVDILDAKQIAEVLAKLKGHDLLPFVAVDLATGLRRGELLAVAWNAVDLEAATLRVERALEETKAHGLRFKAPKTKHGRRTISLPPSVIAVLRAHRRRQFEIRLALGLGRPEPGGLVFCQVDDAVIAPSWLSYTWRNACLSLKLPKVSFQALRHTHASALIAAGLDVVKVSKRLGHSSPVVTLRVYAHLFDRTDTAAADAIEGALRTLVQQ